jgi:hypothetical protein
MKEEIIYSFYCNLSLAVTGGPKLQVMTNVEQLDIPTDWWSFVYCMKKGFIYLGKAQKITFETWDRVKFTRKGFREKGSLHTVYNPRLTQLGLYESPKEYEQQKKETIDALKDLAIEGKQYWKEYFPSKNEAKAEIEKLRNNLTAIMDYLSIFKGQADDIQTND